MSFKTVKILQLSLFVNNNSTKSAVSYKNISANLTLPIRTGGKKNKNTFMLV